MSSGATLSSPSDRPSLDMDGLDLTGKAHAKATFLGSVSPLLEHCPAIGPQAAFLDTGFGMRIGPAPVTGRPSPSGGVHAGYDEPVTGCNSDPSFWFQRSAALLQLNIARLAVVLNAFLGSARDSHSPPRLPRLRLTDGWLVFKVSG